jgi:hypothetical protein
MLTLFRGLALIGAMIVLTGAQSCSSDSSTVSQQPAQPAGSGAVAEKLVLVQWPPPVSGGAIELAKELNEEVYLVLFDNSGSMTERDCSGNLSKFNLARKALKRFARTVPLKAPLALMVFANSGAKVVVPFGVGATHRDQFDRTLDGLSADMGTPLRGALGDAYKVMTEQGQRQLGYGTYRLVTLTDGESGDGNPAATAKDIAKTPIELMVIGFCTGKGHSLNIPGHTRYFTAGNPEELTKGLEAVQQAEVPVFDVGSFSKVN